jgi:drug/metabolite transporter (DMT)-like permease
VAGIDALLLLMTVIWGTNYAIVKSTFGDIDPLAFNALRLTLASAVFLGAMVSARRLRLGAGVFFTPARVTRRDWLALAGLGLVGHTIYQYCFIAGLARTSVANSALLMAATPIAVALLTAAVGQDRVGGRHWLGTALSVVGIYVVIGHGARLSGESAPGDLLVAIGVVCWAIYTVGARPLMLRHSPVGVTGLSMSVGTLFYVPLMWRHLARLAWSGVSLRTWAILVYSTLFAICIAYTIWYAAVREIGTARTSVYSNLTPIVAMAFAVFWIGEPLSAVKIAGAALVLLGVALTRVGGRRIAAPAE